MATLPVTASGDTDFRGGPAETGIDRIEFQTSGPGTANATFAPAQFGAGLISNSVHIVGDSFSNQITVAFSSAATFSAAGWTFENWGSNDAVLIVGSTGNDNITGSSKLNVIQSKGGLDHIDAGEGDDNIQITLNAVSVGTTIEGGDGFDQLSILVVGTTDLRPAAITGVEKLLFGAGTDARIVIVGGDQVSTGGFTTIESGSPPASLIVRDDSVDLSGVAFLNWDADDTIIIEGTSSILNTLTGSSQKDTIGGSLNSTDNMTGGDGADTLNGAGGNDNFFYKAANEVDVGETLNGAVGTDTIRFENAGANDFRNATIIDVEEIDFVSGNSTATFEGSSFDSGEIATVSGSGGIDQLIITTADQVTDIGDVNFTGWGSIDTITILGSGTVDLLGGSAQADIIDGGGAADFMHGEAGNDTYVVNISNDSVNETAGEGTDLVQSSVTFTLSASQSIENLTLTGSANTNGIGNALNNALVGNSGVNTLTGGEGADRFDGGDGADTLDGGLGNDLYLLGGGNDTVLDSGGIDRITSTISRDLNGFAAIENLTLVGTASINATGNGLANSLLGNSGDNVLDGGAGVDALDGGGGNDTFLLGSGTDSVADSGGTDTIGSTISRSLAGFATIERLSLSGTANINATGNALANTLTGNSGANALNGGAGIDTLNGGQGDDTYTLDSDADIITDSGGFDTLASTVTRSLVDFATVERLVLAGTADINGTGNSLNNTLIGNTGKNTLAGGDGVDTMIGGLGRDIYTGGAGNDVFDWNAVAETGADANTRDAVTDFAQGQDKIDLATIDANGAVAGDAAFVFIGTTAFTSGANRLRFFQIDDVVDQTVIEGDIDGNAVADFQIRLTGLINLAAADFNL